jgi:hypothetical protein
MPYADAIATVRSWVEDRAIAVWTMFAGDPPTAVLAALDTDLQSEGRKHRLSDRDRCSTTPADTAAADDRRIGH